MSNIIGSDYQAQYRKLFVDAALTPDGTSRVSSAAMHEAVTAALANSDLSLRVFSSQSVGTQVPIKINVTNDEGGTFTLSGQILLTIKETRPEKTRTVTSNSGVATASIVVDDEADEPAPVVSLVKVPVPTAPSVA